MDPCPATAQFSPRIPGGAPRPAQPSDAAACHLLRSVARWPSAVDTSAIRALAARIQDWDALISLAQVHRVALVLFACLSGLEIPVPESAVRQLDAEFQRNMVHNLASAAELAAILELFDGAGLRAMPFKGVVLAATAWGGLTRRPGGDLDFLIDEQHIEHATRLLRERGYRLRTALHPDGLPIEPDNHEYLFERLSDRLAVELRWRLDMVYGRFGRNLGLDWVWPRRRTATVAGATVPDLSPDTALLILCMHGSKHNWSRLVWIMDVARMADSSPDLDWTALIHEAHRLGLGRALALGMLLAHQVAGAALPPGVLARFCADHVAERLAAHFSQNLFLAPGVQPEGVVPYNIQLLDFRDRLRLLPSLALLRPNEHDRAFVSLPRPLHGLYYLIRPFRILLNRSAR
jgi:Uncharacterised nucleotidyltransferase